jgi:hypothetical protein
MKPSNAVKPGAKIMVIFNFADGSKTNAEFAVRDAKGN